MNSAQLRQYLKDHSVPPIYVDMNSGRCPIDGEGWKLYRRRMLLPLLGFWEAIY